MATNTYVARDVKWDQAEKRLESKPMMRCLKHLKGFFIRTVNVPIRIIKGYLHTACNCQFE